MEEVGEWLGTEEDIRASDEEVVEWLRRFSQEDRQEIACAVTNVEQEARLAIFISMINEEENASG